MLKLADTSLILINPSPSNVKRDTIFSAARNFFGPSYFVTEHKVSSSEDIDLLLVVLTVCLLDYLRVMGRI